jgi:hypothetical protein
MKSFATTLVAAGVLGVASLASTAPAEAQYWHRCWNCGGGVAAGVIGGTLLGLGVGSVLATPPYQGPGTLAPYQYGPGPYAYGPAPYAYGPAPYYTAPPAAAYACHYERFHDYDAYGYPIVVRRRVCD